MLHSLPFTVGPPSLGPTLVLPLLTLVVGGVSTSLNEVRDVLDLTDTLDAQPIDFLPVSS